MEDNKMVYDFYERKYDESVRFAPNPLEFIRSKDIIGRFLEKPALTIADIGGAVGTYSYWLAEQGHKVHLMDLSDKHIQLAKDYGKKIGIELSSLACGDARKLPYKDDNFDMVLNMGALYHLQESGDRMKCIKESHRVLKSDGRAIFAYISRYASLVDGYKYQFVNDPEFQRIIENDLKTGNHYNPKDIPDYFTTAYFHTPDLIMEELSQCGFREVKLYAVEGFASIIDTDDTMKDEQKRERLLDHLKRTEEVPELLGISSHIIAACVK